MICHDATGWRTLRHNWVTTLREPQRPPAIATCHQPTGRNGFGASPFIAKSLGGVSTNRPPEVMNGYEWLMVRLMGHDRA